MNKVIFFYYFFVFGLKKSRGNIFVSYKKILLSQKKLK